MRRLAIVCFSFSAAIFASAYLLPFSALPVIAAVLLAFAILLLLSRRVWVRPLMLALFGAAVGLGWFYVHDLQTLLPARLLDGSEREVQGVVQEYPQNYGSYSRAVVKVSCGDLQPLEALVYDGKGGLLDAQPGDTVSFTARISSADRRYGEASGVYLARDLYLKLNTRSEVSVVEKASAFSMLPVRVQHTLLGHITKLFPPDVRSFMKSLMLGDKSDLYRDEAQYLALSRAGNMHALAVSGLHIAFLIGMLQLLFGKNAFCSCLCVILSWCFVLLTGASPSAVRAAIMQSILLMAPVLRRENDPPTTLSFALAVILLGNPRAAASVSLQLSFAAMAGILCFGARLNSFFLDRVSGRGLRKLLAGPASALSSSLAVLPFTVPLMVLHFGYVSVVSPISAVLCYLAISLCFCGGYLACLASLVLLPLGRCLAWVTAWIARYIVWASSLTAGIPYGVLYMELPWCVFWIGGAYLLFLLFRLLPLRRGEKLLIPTLLSVLSLILLMNITRLHYEQGDGFFSAVNVGQGECLCAFAGEQTVVIDCGNQMAAENAGDLAGRFLIARGRGEVDALILTHLDADHVNGASMLMEMLPVKRLILPGASEDNALYSGIQALAERKKTELILLERDAELQLDSLAVNLYAPITEGEDNEQGLFALLHFGSYDVLVTGDASAETEELFIDRVHPENVELLIAGHHGSKYSTGEALLRSTGADTALICTGYNTYGHPAEETLERLSDFGYTVYRTDLDGTVIIHIEDGHGEKKR